MVDARAVIVSFFIMLKEDIYVLMRIEILVALVTVMFLVMFIMDFYRCRSRGSVVISALKTVDSLSDQIVVYLLGAMQSAGFENQLFPVWAIVLVSLRASLGYLSGYGIMDRERRLTEVANVTKFLGVGVLNGTRGLKFARPLWSLWAILLLRSIYRTYAGERAIRSLWHGRSSEFLPDYMHTRASATDIEQNNTSARDDGQSGDLEKYLVYGDSDQKIDVKRPEYTLHLEVVKESSLVTLSNILKCTGTKPLLNPQKQTSNSYRDMSLAFTLSRLLRCRLEDVKLHPGNFQNIEQGDLIRPKTTGVLYMDTKRAFRILELELAFVRDYFYTLYPMVFWQGLGSLGISLLQSMVTFAAAFWLAVGIRKVYRPPTDTLALLVGGCNVDVVITWVFLFFMMFKEVWEMVTYLLSNWTRLLLVCKYAQSQFQSMSQAITESLISSFFNSSISDPWHGCIDQYDFLKSYNYKPYLWKLAYKLSRGKTPKKSDGKIIGKAIKIPDCAKVALHEHLQRIDLSKAHLPGNLPLPSELQQFEKYSWACFELKTCSKIILVWHIATSLCEIKFAEDHRINAGFFQSAWSYLKDLSCYTCKPLVVQKDVRTVDELEKARKADELKTNNRIANSLSRYCAYLQAFRSELLPDTFLVPDAIFVETLQDARQQLKDCKSVQRRYRKLMVEAQTAPKRTKEELLGMSILQQGANLAMNLMKEEEGICWKILARIWTGLVVHIAPSWNAADHKNSLESGGEFITLIWALLWHCGIEKSELWQKDEEASESDAEAPHDDAETRMARRMQEQDQTSERDAEAPHDDAETRMARRMQEQYEASESDAEALHDDAETRMARRMQEQDQVSEINAERPQENDAYRAREDNGRRHAWTDRYSE